MVQQFWRRSRRSRRSSVPLKDRIFFSHYITSIRFCLNNFTRFFLLFHDKNSSLSRWGLVSATSRNNYNWKQSLIWRETLPVCFQTFPVHYWIQTEDTPSAHSKVVEQRRPLWVLLLLVLRLRGSTIKHSHIFLERLIHFFF